MSIARMRRSELKNAVRRFAAEIISNSAPLASGHFEELTDEEMKLVDDEMGAIARRIEPEQAFTNRDF